MGEGRGRTLSPLLVVQNLDSCLIVHKTRVFERRYDRGDKIKGVHRPSTVTYAIELCLLMVTAVSFTSLSSSSIR